MKGQSTVEGLHASFAKIDDRVRALIDDGKTDNDLMACIHNAWLQQFHSDISPAAVKGMVVHYRAVHGSEGSGSKSGRKTRKQKGGMAPIGWTMGQGSTDFTYGRFPVEIGTTPNTISALDLGRFYESNVGRSVNSTGGHAAPGQLGGSSQKGAGIFDALAMPHFPASVPRNFIEATGSSLQGAPIVNPSSSPVSASPTQLAYSPTPYDANSISNISSMSPIYKPST